MWRHIYLVSAYIATLPYVTLTCLILSCHVTILRVPVKIAVQVLAAGCQLSYRNFYGFFFTLHCLIFTETDISRNPIDYRIVLGPRECRKVIFSYQFCTGPYDFQTFKHTGCISFSLRFSYDLNSLILTLFKLPVCVRSERFVSFLASLFSFILLICVIYCCATILGIFLNNLAGKKELSYNKY